MKYKLVFWFDGPPICCKGVFDAVAKIWDNQVYYIITKEIDSERAQITSSFRSNLKNLEYIYLNEETNSHTAANSFIEEHTDDIHIFSGYVNGASKYMKQLLKTNPKAKVLIWAERVGYRGKNKNSFSKKIRDVLVSFRHRYYAIRLRNKISALLPLGKKGVVAYKKLGWRGIPLFPFLYLPVMNENIKYINTPLSDNHKVRFVYLGRFSNGWKGTDILIEACKKVKNKNYQLDMIGGYGDYKEQTLAYIEKNSHLFFGGTWPISEACDRLSTYDVCIVPTRYEGWNVTVNEALMAGIGCITTKESVSDELVENSHAGMVVDVDSNQIANAMDMVMKNPVLINEWKRNAYLYRENMTADANAKYFIEILEYLFSDIEKKRPIAPWEK